MNKYENHIVQNWHNGKKITTSYSIPKTNKEDLHELIIMIYTMLTDINYTVQLAIYVNYQA